MAKNANTNVASVKAGSASDVVVEGLGSLDEKKARLKELLRQKKAAEELRVWETKTKTRNPQYVVGSLRAATDADAEHLSHMHGMVCEIECATCGTRRLVNKQDAFQVRFCQEHKRDAAKRKRAEAAKAAAADPSKLAAEIEALQKELAG